MLVDVYDQNTSTVAFWSLASAPGHVGIQHGNLTWHKIQPGPIRCLYGPSPLIQPIYIFFYEFFVSFMDQAQHCSLFIFGPWPFCLNSFILFFFSKLGPLVMWVPHCQVLVLGPSHQGNILHFFISRK